MLNKLFLDNQKRRAWPLLKLKTKISCRLILKFCIYLRKPNHVVDVFRFNEFDHKFFGISDSEVEQMDPQQKQVLQCVYRALENAGLPMEEASGTRTGVFFGKNI